MKSLFRVVACLSLCVGFNANAITVYSVNEVRFEQIWSPTFDGLGQPVVDDGSFFGVIPNVENPIYGLNRQVDYVEVNTTTNNGGGFIAYDGTTLLSLTLLLPDGILKTFAQDNPQYTETYISGASIVGLDLPTTDGGNDHNFDVSGNGIDPIAAFSEYNDVAQSCVGPLCAVLPFLHLDFVRYTLEGIPSTNGGDNYLLRGQVSNTSYLEISFTTAPSPVPLPAGITLFLSGLVGFLGIKVRNA